MIKNSLDNILKPDQNNFDLTRLICASLVIVGHAASLAPHLPDGYQDPFQKYIGVHSSSIAVYIFFMLSGLLVTNSLDGNRRIFDFVISRLFRIYPALIALLIVTVMAGAVLTNLELTEYIRHSSTIQYVIKNVFLGSQYHLPGVFESNKYPGAVNGSLWTIRYEVIAYITLGAFFVSGVFNRYVALLLFMVISVEYFKLTTIFFPKNGPEVYLAYYFSFGSVLAFWKRELFLSSKSLVIMVFFLWISKGTLIEEFVIHMSCFVVVIVISSANFYMRFKPRYDISYGVYLYGFPIAQVLSLYFVELDIYSHILLTLCASYIFGFISAYLVEIPMIKFGRHLQK